jgi:hypothetical protein
MSSSRDAARINPAGELHLHASDEMLSSLSLPARMDLSHTRRSHSPMVSLRGILTRKGVPALTPFTLGKMDCRGFRARIGGLEGRVGIGVEPLDGDVKQ